MLRCIRLICVSIMVLFSCNQYIHATEINAANYDIYVGDINSDGTRDFFFKGKPLIIILSGDIATPIAIFPNADLIVYRNDSSYSTPSLFTLSSSDLSNRVANGSLRLASSPADYTLIVDSSQGQTEISIKSGADGVPDLVLLSSASAQIPTLIRATNLSFEYDVLGRLIKVNNNGALKTNYKYDNAGNRKEVIEN